MVRSLRHISRFWAVALGLLAVLALLIPSPALAAGLSFDLQEWCKYKTGVLQMGSNVGSWTPNENAETAVLFDDSNLYNVSIVKVDYWVANGQMVGNSSGFRKMQCYALLSGNSGTQNNGLSFTDDDDRIDGVFIGNLKWTGLYISPGSVQSVLTATQIVTAGAAPNGWDYSYYYKRATSFNFSQQGMCMDLSEGYYPKITVLYSRYGGEWTPHKADYSKPYDVVVAQSVNGDERTLLQLILAAMQQELENISDNLDGGGSTTVNVDTSTIESNQGTTNSTLSNINTNVTSGFSSVNSTLTSGFSGLNNTLGTVSSNITSAVSTAQSAVTGAISTAQSAITSGLSSLGTTLSNIASTLPTFGKGQYGNGSGVSISTQTKNNFETLLQTKAPVCYFVMVNDEIGRLSSTYSSASLASNSNLYIDLPIPYAGNVRFDLKESFLGQAVGNVYLYNGIRFALTLFLVVMIVYGGSRLALSIAFGGSDD